MRVWVSKYALSEGLFEVDGEVTREGGISYTPPNGGLRQYYYGSDWHATKESAIARAEEMRIRKLKSLNKQIENVTALKFD